MTIYLGENIKKLRREKGITQETLAEFLGVTFQSVSNWERGESYPDITMLPEIAGFFKVSVDELLTGEKDEAPVVRVLPENERRDIGDMMLRIVATSAGGDMARINLPLAIIEVALDSGLNMLQISGSEALKNIDLCRIMDMVKQGAIGNIVEVEDVDGDAVKIFVE